MIEVRNISKSFGDNTVLNNVSHIFERGRNNLIIGTSGSGKSVLTKCIVGLMEPDEGEVLYDGTDFTNMGIKDKKKIRQEIGMLFQGSALFDSMTVEENVMFPLKMFADMTKEEMQKRVDFCLDRVHLKDANDLLPAELSGGMQKRVGIARAISLNPKYLFCDEPNSGLDPQTSNVIDALIAEITEEYKITTVVITHDMNSVLEIGDNIMFISEGEKCWEGDKNTVLKTDNEKLIDLVFASNFMKEVAKNS